MKCSRLAVATLPVSYLYNVPYIIYLSPNLASYRHSSRVKEHYQGARTPEQIFLPAGCVSLGQSSSSLGLTCNVVTVY